MRRPFLLASGLVLVAAAAGGFVGPLYEESATSCGSLLRPDPAASCDTYEGRRRLALALLLVLALPSVLAGFRGSPRPDRGRHEARPLGAAAAGLLAIPVAFVVVLGVVVLHVGLYETSQADTGVPSVFAPAALALGALASSRASVASGARTGTAVAAAAAGLPLLLGVQAAVEAARWELGDVPAPLRLTGPFSSGGGTDAADLLTLVLAALPLPLLLAAAARSRRQVPVGPAVAALLVSALVGSVLLAAADSRLGSFDSVRWLPVLVLPAVLPLLLVVRPPSRLTRQ